LFESIYDEDEKDNTKNMISNKQTLSDSHSNISESGIHFLCIILIFQEYFQQHDIEEKNIKVNFKFFHC